MPFSIILLFAVVLQWIKSFPTYPEARSEQIIHSFMASKGIHAKPGTPQHRLFMRQIIWGEFPELTGDHSEFITGPGGLDALFNYAWKYSGYQELYAGYAEPDPPEALTPP